jgi:hypothetical protein
MAAPLDPERRPKPLKLSVRPTRKLSAPQAYGRLYRSKLKPILDKKWEQHIAKNPDAARKKGEQLRYRNELLKELLAVEMDEVKQRVNSCREEGVFSDDETPEPEAAGEGMSVPERQRRAKADAFQKYVLSSFYNDAS